jgi:hypothetical protein
MGETGGCGLYLPYHCPTYWQQGFVSILRILQEGHTPAAEAASTEGQQQDTAITL